MSLISRANCSEEWCKKNVKFVLASRFISVVGFAPVEWYDLSQKIGLGTAMRSGCGGVPHRIRRNSCLRILWDCRFVKITIA